MCVWSKIKIIQLNYNFPHDQQLTSATWIFQHIRLSFYYIAARFSVSSVFHKVLTLKKACELLAWLFEYLRTTRIFNLFFYAFIELIRKSYYLKLHHTNVEDQTAFKIRKIEFLINSTFYGNIASERISRMKKVRHFTFYSTIHLSNAMNPLKHNKLHEHVCQQFHDVNHRKFSIPFLFFFFLFSSVQYHFILYHG